MLAADGLSLRVPSGRQQRVEGIGDIVGFSRNVSPPGRPPGGAEDSSLI